MQRKRIAVGLSGGVDSAVAAALLRDAGHEVIGVSMKIWGGTSKSWGGTSKTCGDTSDACGDASDALGGTSAQVDPQLPTRHACYGPGEEEDIADCERICAALGIEFHVIDLVKEFDTTVLQRCRNEYQSGLTPNPCVHCNRRVKFGLIPERLRQMGVAFDLFATGHYAIIDSDVSTGRYRLRMAKDRAKDQTYFLCFLTQRDLAGTIFPLGEWLKADVRSFARARSLPVAERPESQDFVTGDHVDVIGGPDRPGPILDVDGNVIGHHRGVHRFTIGQRRGLGVARPEPLYVIEIDAVRQAVIAGPADYLLGSGLTASDVNWISGEAPPGAVHVTARIRYRHSGATALVTPIGDSRARVEFDEPQRAITPGQAVVFYDGDVLVGGGLIERATAHQDS